MAQLMPLPLTLSCFSKIQIGVLPYLPAHLGSHLGNVAVKLVCVCVRACVCVCMCMSVTDSLSFYTLHCISVLSIQNVH